MLLYTTQNQNDFGYINMMTQISIRDLTVDIDLTVPKRFIVIHCKKIF